MTQQGINNASMLKVGTILRGTYRIDSYLSSGGFGNTYVATNIEFDERVAIKEFFMKGITQRDDNQTTVSVSNSENTNSFLEQKEKFKKEARRIRQLNNPHIVRVHDLFEENGTAYYVMDYVDGENLGDRLKRTDKPMTEDEINQILPQILDSLKSIHDAGIWHLDLKPANIMVDKSGNVKLIDFGASKQLNVQKGGATTSTAISYTNGYAPREQMEQNYEKFGPWTDIYSLGATLYNLLTNKRPPLPSDIDDDKTDDKHIVLSLPKRLTASMKELVLLLMQTDRSKRPQCISDVITLFRDFNKENKNNCRPNSYNANNIDEETITSYSQRDKAMRGSGYFVEDTEPKTTLAKSHKGICTYSLISINIVVFVIAIISLFLGKDIVSLGGLHFFLAKDFSIFQLFSYSFFHGGLSELLFTMLCLWYFGRSVEGVLGAKKFILLYLLSGLSVGFLQEIAYYLSYSFNNVASYEFVKIDGGEQIKTENYINLWVSIGSSGCVNAIFTSFCMLFPKYKIFKLNIKWLFVIYIILDVFLILAVSAGEFRIAYMGGLLVGFLMIKYWEKSLDMGIIPN